MRGKAVFAAGDHFHPGISSFLHEEMEKGLAFSTLKTQMAALSVFLETQLS